MHIYIDESGSFVLPREQRSSLSCVAALIVSESEHNALLAGFEALAGAWGYSSGEIKGRSLNESQFAQVIKLLRGFKHTFLRLAAIDMGLHSESVVTNHKKRQAQDMRDRIGSQFHPDLVSQIHKLADRIEGTSNQLYVEFVLLTQLVTSVIQTSTLYYSQSEPGSLSRFRWRIDAKADSPTDYEQMWRLLVTPFAQSQSLRSPALFLRGGDYSAFSRFQNPDLPRAPEYLSQAVKDPTATFCSFDLGRVIQEDLAFHDSQDMRGLQLVDILASCFRRACHGRLQREGWEDLGRVIMTDPQDVRALKLCAFSHEIAQGSAVQYMQYTAVFNEIERKAKEYLVHRPR
jgi:hypothetical protein